jgi:hypothetical protein
VALFDVYVIKALVIEMTTPFLWTNMSCNGQITGGAMFINNLHHRSSDSDKVFDKLVPVQLQLGGNEERRQSIRLCVELVQGNMASASYRKVLIIIYHFIFINKRLFL